MSIKAVTPGKLGVFKNKVYEYIHSHTGDTGIHVTTSEKNSWNSKADSSAIPTDEHINSLIDAKLGAIENGSY